MKARAVQHSPYVQAAAPRLSPSCAHADSAAYPQVGFTHVRVIILMSSSIISSTRTTSRVERFETVVIGGGQAGLSVGHHLAERDVDHVILSDEERVGDNWR